ncbi:MAG: hypothetical protein WCQ89_23775, partial [Verrucomicrobiota bacterium]
MKRRNPNPSPIIGASYTMRLSPTVLAHVRVTDIDPDGTVWVDDLDEQNAGHVSAAQWRAAKTRRIWTPPRVKAPGRKRNPKAESRATKAVRRVTEAFKAGVLLHWRGRTADGRNFADLQVTPSNSGISMRVEATTPTDPVRNFHIWMPAWNGQSFAGQRWQPGADFSPFHPLYLQRLQPFGTLRFMGMQETNSSDIRTWADRRDANNIRQGSGIEGSPSEPLANGMSVEYMV